METNKALEQKELDSLLEKGIEIEIGNKKFVIHEPTLGVLDLLSDCFIKIQFEEQDLLDNPMIATRAIGKSASKVFARIIAIAVLGRNCAFVVGRLGSPLSYITTNNVKINRLAKFFLLNTTPAKLLEIAMIISQMSNYGDFINSIRLVAGARTTKPNQIEEENK